MDYIYARASCVLIWLGISSVPDLGNYLSSPALKKFKIEWDRCRSFYKTLIDHKYRTRLWIIQEIGLSMSLRVCVGSDSLDRTTFLKQIRSFFSEQIHVSINRLDTKRRDRHGKSNRLEVLIEDFQDAQCAEPRDKIYGFLGMAHDCQDGTIEADYTKSLFDLYADVIAFFCRRRKLQNGESNDLDRCMRVVRFSQLVQRLLGGVTYNITAPMNPSSSQTARVNTSQILQARAAITGEILDIGPTYQEMISSSSANRRWRLSFEKWYSLPLQVQTLREASEAYSLVLLDMTDQELAKICSIRPCDMYTKGIIAKSTWNGNDETWDHQEPDDQIGRDTDDISSNTVLPDSTLIKEPEGPHMFLGNNCLMGLAPFEAAPGDKICQFWKSDVVALLRKEKDSSVYRVIGRLDLSRGYLEDLEPKYIEAGSLSLGEEVMIIEMDIRALGVLTC